MATITGHKKIEPVIGTGSMFFLRCAALWHMGYTSDEMTGHGFRSKFSTLMHEMQWPSHLIERQLAHKQRDSVKAGCCRLGQISWMGCLKAWTTWWRS